MTDLCDLLGHGPADMGADPVPKSDCLVCQIEAKDKRIAELEKANAQLMRLRNLIERARSIADDAMGMEPEDRHTVSELINEIEAKDKRIAELEKANAQLMRPIGHRPAKD